MLYMLPKAMVSVDLHLLEPVKPTITGFARIETSPISPQLDDGLSAPLADPLWLIGRQWQFNELRGEDAGTPIGVDIDVHASPIDRFAPGPGATLAQTVALEDGGAPIEVRVEAEPALAAHARLDGEAGLNLLRRARARGLAGLVATLRGPDFALDLRAPDDPQSDLAGEQWHLLLAARSISAAKVAGVLAPLRGADGHLAAVPAELPLPIVEVADALAVLDAWLQWLDTLVHEGAADNASWRKERFEYAFSLYAKGRARDVALRADEYTDGRVDWHSFVAESEGAANPAPPPEPVVKLRDALPVPVRYPGMPADRYWEFEDARVNFAAVESSPASVVRMVMTEFGLAYGNDWFLLPLDLPVGALYDLGGFRVRDTFGVEATVRAADHAALPAAAGAPWRMFELATRGAVAPEVKDTLCLPDTLSGTLEGPPLEELLLVRDEMANLAWGIERRVQGTSGEPLDRKLEADHLAFRQRLPEAPDDPLLVYRLATQVPAHWIPLVPKGDGGALRFTVKLQRGGMARFYSVEPALMADPAYAGFIELLRLQDTFIEEAAVENGVQMFVLHPRGRLLKVDPGAQGAALATDSLAVAEEEVPRAGAIVRRSFQYARTSDGRAYLWIGRSKTAGTGESHSGLSFDSVRKRSAIN
jgi:hypothetical protein